MSFHYKSRWLVVFFDSDRRRTQLPRKALGIASLKHAAGEDRSPLSLGLIGTQFLRENSMAGGQFMYFRFRLWRRGAAHRSVLSGVRNVRTGGAGLPLLQPCEQGIRHCNDCRR